MRIFIMGTKTVGKSSLINTIHAFASSEFPYTLMPSFPLLASATRVTPEATTTRIRTVCVDGAIGKKMEFVDVPGLPSISIDYAAKI
jgi:predicted GTPase